MESPIYGKIPRGILLKSSNKVGLWKRLTAPLPSSFQRPGDPERGYCFVLFIRGNGSTSQQFTCIARLCPLYCIFYQSAVVAGEVDFPNTFFMIHRLRLYDQHTYRRADSLYVPDAKYPCAQFSRHVHHREIHGTKRILIQPAVAGCRDALFLIQRGDPYTREINQR